MGLERSPAVTAPSPDEIRAVIRLLRTHLGGSSRVRLMPEAPVGELREAVARYGSGLDHAGGEVPLGLVKARLGVRARALGHCASYVVTDRRVLGRVELGNVQRTFTEVPYADVVAVAGRPGRLVPSFDVQLMDGPRTLYVVPRRWHDFFAAMVAGVPPISRTFGPVALPAGSARDPTGALAAVGAVGTSDPRTWVPLRVLFEAERRRMLESDEAAWFVPDMIMLARGVAAGRGAYGPKWQSVLPQPVLSLALRLALGPPATVQLFPHGEVFEFRAAQQPGGGIGCVSTSHPRRLAGIRVHADDDSGAATFELFGAEDGQWEPLSTHWWRAVDEIHQELFRLEARYLLGRVLFGPRLPPGDLLTLPRPVLQNSVAELLGPTDLEPFYRS